MNQPLRAAFRALLLGTIVMLVLGLAAVGTEKFRFAGTVAQSPDLQLTIAGDRDATSRPRPSQSSATERQQVRKQHAVKQTDRTARTGSLPDERMLAAHQTAASVDDEPPRTQRISPATSHVRPDRSNSGNQRLERNDPRVRVVGESSQRPNPRIQLGPIVVDNGAANQPETQFDIKRVEKPRGAVFRSVPSIEMTNANSTSGVEARLIGMERQLTQMAQLQTQQNDIKRATELLQQMQQSTHLEKLQRQLQELQAASEKSAKAAQEAAVKAADEAKSKEQERTKPAEPAVVLKAEPATDDPEQFSIRFQDAEIGEVLSMLSELSGLNILVGKGVTGKIPAVNLENVGIEQALQAILRSLGYVFERDDNFVFVMTQEDAAARKQLNRKLITKLYRPHYVSVKDLQALIAPLQTKGIGQLAVTNPIETGIAASSENAGGDSLTQRDALLVQDYEEVIAEIDKIFKEIDVPPMQVVIEAMILDVTLTDTMELGVNFALLNSGENGLILSGNGGTLNSAATIPGTTGISPGANGLIPIPPAGRFLSEAGLKLGYLRGDISTFVEALETLADTNLIASPQIRVLNKQRAELIIGRRLGYQTITTGANGETIQNVEFIDVGMKLLICPLIAPDGRVRLEVHPELSDGTISAIGIPEITTTEVTTNVMVRDGTTVVLGGLISEKVAENYSQIPLLGSIPWLGQAFRSKDESTTRHELIVLITPRIVREDDATEQGESIRIESERRAAYCGRCRQRSTPAFPCWKRWNCVPQSPITCSTRNAGCASANK